MIHLLISHKRIKMPEKSYLFDNTLCGITNGPDNGIIFFPLEDECIPEYVCEVILVIKPNDINETNRYEV